MSEEIGKKKAAEQLGISYYTIADWRKVRSQKAKEERIASDKTPLNERELAMQREIQELKKANKIWTITKHTVTLTPPVNDRVTSNPEIPSDKQVPAGTVIIFTAEPDEGYAVDAGTVSLRTPP